MGDAQRWDLEDALRRAHELANDPERIARQKLAEEARAQRIAAYRARVWRMRYVNAAPVRNAEAAWEARETPAVRAMRDWLKDPCRHLVLRGGVGSGKTTAACVAVKHWVTPVDRELLLDGDVPGATMSSHCEHEVTWLRPDQLVSAVLHDYDEKSPKLRRYVVLDDLGLETKADFAAALCELLDRPGHTLLITTNLTRQSMRSRYDLRLIDRLNDSARAIDLSEKSMRRQDGGF